MAEAIDLLQRQAHFYIYKQQFKAAFLERQRSISSTSANKQHDHHDDHDVDFTKVTNELAQNLRRRLGKLRRVVAVQRGNNSLCFLSKAEDRWLRRLSIELETMSSELSRPLLAADKGVRQGGSMLKMRRRELDFLFDSHDLYRTIKESLVYIGGPTPVHGLPMVLHTASVEDLRKKFDLLHQRFPQIGLDDEALGSTEAKPEVNAFGSKWEVDLEDALDQDDFDRVAHLTKRGCPMGLRPRVWKCLVLDEDDATLMHQRKTLQLCSMEDSVVDSLHYLDLQYIEDNDEYFVFKDLLQQTLSTFSRDPWLRARLGPSARKEEISVMPFKGLIMFAAPLVYLFHSEVDLYMMFRHMYSRYWAKLNSFSSSDPDSILNLCMQFQKLVQVWNPEVVFHLTRLGVVLTEVAFEWIHLAFAKYLRVQQLLHLWDRIIGYDSLLPIPLLAASIVAFKAESLLKASTKEEVEGVLNERRNLNVVALLQNYLHHDRSND